MARQPTSPQTPATGNRPLESDADSDLHDKSHPNGQPPAHQDNVLESLGKAIIAPVKGAADPDDDPTTR